MLVLLVCVSWHGAARAQLISGGRVADRPFPKAFTQFGESIAWSSVSGQADVLVVVDTSATMQDRTQGGTNRVGATADALPFLADALEAADVDYRFRVLGFHEVWDDQTVELSRWTPDVESARTRVKQFGAMGLERLLDVLIQALGLFDGRVSAQKQLIIVCDSAASTAWNAEGGAAELRERITDEALRAGIRVQILGYPESFQRNLASRTSGLFIPMPGSYMEGVGARARVSRARMAPHGLVNAFAEIAGHWLDSAPPSTDADDRVLLLIDYSASMQGRLRATLRGIAEFDEMAHAAGRRPVYTVARFAGSPSRLAHGVDGIDFSPAWEAADELVYYFRRPAAGSEDVQAAVAATGTWIREHGAGLAILVTDEPPSRATKADAAKTWFDSDARLYGIMPLREPDRRSPRTRELVAAVEATGGIALPMPDASYVPSARR